MKDLQSYVFSCINNTSAEPIELTDESRRLCDVKPFCSVLKVIEREDATSDRHLDSNISLLIGKGLHEFASLKNSEVNDFRWKMRLLGDEIAIGRQHQGWEEKVRYQYPPRLSTSSIVPKNVQKKIKDGNIVVMIKFENKEVSLKKKNLLNLFYLTSYF